MTNIKPSMLDLTSCSDAELGELREALTAEIVSRGDAGQGLNVFQLGESLGGFVYPGSIEKSKGYKEFMEKVEKMMEEIPVISYTKEALATRAIDWSS